MTGQSKGTSKSKVKISPVCLGILLWDWPFAEICLFSVKTDSYDTKSPKRQLSHWYWLFFNAVCANQWISPGQKKSCRWSGNEVVQRCIASEGFCQTEKVLTNFIRLYKAWSHPCHQSAAVSWQSLDNVLLCHPVQEPAISWAEERLHQRQETVWRPRVSSNQPIAVF